MKIKVRMTDQKSHFKVTRKEYSKNESFTPSMRDVQTITRTIGEPFEGAYEYFPTFETQTLNTANKYLAEDLIIEAIRVSTVTNLSGGNTIYIGVN